LIGLAPAAGAALPVSAFCATGIQRSTVSRSLFRRAHACHVFRSGAQLMNHALGGTLTGSCSMAERCMPA
jgi:hypothetical protein